MKKNGLRARRAFLLNTLGALAALGAGTLKVAPVAAQSGYPNRPIRLVIPFAAGSATDIMTRQLEPSMARTLGQPLVIENRPGAAGVIGAELVKRAAPDGYTLLMSAVSAHSIAAAMRPKTMPYNAISDFTPIARVCTSTNFIVAHPSVPARSLQELIAYSKTQPKGLSFASGGIGGSNHLAGELLRLKGANLVHVPYNNQSQAVTDTVAGHVPLLIYTVALLPFVRDGRLRALAVTSEQRQKQAPDIPTAIEQGVPGMVANSWFALFGPAQLPVALRDRVFAALKGALAEPANEQKLVETGLEPALLPPDEFLAFLERDAAMWAEVVARSGVPTQ